MTDLRPGLEYTLDQLIDGRNRAVSAGAFEDVAAIDAMIAELDEPRTENTAAYSLPERRNQ